MSRYVIKFYKEGYIKYTSHLDMLRLFKRSFKRSGMKLQYSQGFNPHPKMSFAQPLSLGYTSSSEYLEFETIEPLATEKIINLLNSIMPEGIGILACEELEQGGKTLAALTDEASYEISIPFYDQEYNGISGGQENIENTVREYLSQEAILIKKLQKKSRKEVEIDIKPMIKEIKGSRNNNYIMLSAVLSAGSTENLSPEMILTTFCSFAGIEYDRSEVLMKRTGIHFIK